MRYKSFVFPNNPRTCKYDVDRSYAKHKYPELNGAELEDMDADAVVISGDGEFFGPDAYTHWNNLVNIFHEHGVGEFYHPVYTDVSSALMTKLSSNLEPRQDYVSYSFEFVAHSVIPWIRTLIPEDNTSQNTDTSVVDQNNNRIIVVGDTVICNGYAYYTSYGDTPRSAKMTNKIMCVTHVNYKGSHPIHVGSIGWMRLEDVALGTTTSSASASSSTIEYVVKAGDTLSAIGVKYGIPWKTLASFNNLSNPHLIYPGDVIKIPK